MLSKRAPRKIKFFNPRDHANSSEVLVNETETSEEKPKRKISAISSTPAEFGPLLQRIHKFCGNFRIRATMKQDWLQQWQDRSVDLETEEECCEIWDEVVLNEPFWAGSDSPFMNTNAPVASFVRNMESGKLPMEFARRKQLQKRLITLPSTEGKPSKEYTEMVHSWFKAEYLT